MKQENENLRRRLMTQLTNLLMFSSSFYTKLIKTVEFNYATLVKSFLIIDLLNKVNLNSTQITILLIDLYTIYTIWDQSNIESMSC